MEVVFLLYGGLHSKQLPPVQTDRHSASKPSRLQESSGGADRKALHTGSPPPRPGQGAPRRAATHDLPQRLNASPTSSGGYLKTVTASSAAKGAQLRDDTKRSTTVLHVPTIPSFVSTRASKDFIHYLSINNPAYKPISIIICKHSSTYTRINIISTCFSIMLSTTHIIFWHAMAVIIHVQQLLTFYFLPLPSYPLLIPVSVRFFSAGNTKYQINGEEQLLCALA